MLARLEVAGTQADMEVNCRETFDETVQVVGGRGFGRVSKGM